MSMHFVPQWVKPIKPTGSTQATTPTALNGGLGGSGSGGDLASPSSLTGSKPSQPFPALGGGGANGGRGSPTTATAPNPALSYSRATYTPQSPGIADTSYFPDQVANPGNPHPFRYSREQILGLYDENKFKEVPMELLDLLDQNGILVSKQPVKPVGLRELTEGEKKILATNIHPQVTRSRPNTSTNDNSTPSRRSNPSNKDSLSMSNGSRIGRFGQGQGENAFGSGKIGTIGAIGGAVGGGAGGTENRDRDARAPGAIGGGFGGVGKRMGLGRRQESTDERTSNWRPTRTNSGNFEGVLGFGGASASSNSAGGTAAPPIAEDPAIAGAGEEKKDTFGSGGGPGWGGGPKKWRMAAAQSEEEKTLLVPNAADHKPVESLAATPSATPLPDRDADVANIAPPAETPVVAAATPQPLAQETKEDLGAIEWYYRDPAGQEQGPFIATQMHEWFSHSYFQDDLPLRRSHETTFHTLGELKQATNSQVQPFLTAVRPRLPPNLPLPVRTPSGLGVGPMSPAQLGPNGGGAFPTDAFRQMSLGQPMQPGMHGHGFGGAPFSPAGAASFMHSPGFGSPAAPMHPHHQPSQHAPWGPMTPGHNNHMQTPFRGPVETPIRSPFGPAPGAAEPFGGMYGAPGPFSPAPGAAAGGMPFGGQAGWYGNQGFRPPQPQQQMQQQMQPSQHLQQQMPEGNDPFVSTLVENQHQQQQQQQQQQQASASTPAPIEQIQQQTSPVKQAIPVADPTPVQAPVELAPEGEPASEEPVAELAPVQPAASANPWGQTTKSSQPPSRKASIAAPVAPIVSPKKPTTSLARDPSPAPAAEQAPAPAPAPVRAASPPAPKQDKPAPITLSNVIDKAISPSPATVSASGPKAAPWAQKDEKEKAGPSLRQIQEAEAKQAESRRAARAAAQLQAQQAAAYASATGEELPASMTWGLASSGSGKANASNAALASPSVATPPAAVWGGGDAAAPKKTLKQIQEEEEKRAKAQKAKAAAVSAATVSTASGSNGSAVPKRGYADLAAAPAAPVPGWSTVGAGGKPIPGAAPKAAAPASAAPLIRSTSTAASARPASAAGTARSNGPAAPASLDDTYTPSLDFIKWAKTALSGLRTPIDEFLQICLSFPIDPPGQAKAEGAEIISEMVYANSGTLDGRRFAADFFDKRKADAKKQAQDKANAAKGGWTTMSSASATQANLADVVKSVQSKKEDAGFKVVKAKGKKK